MVPNCEIEGSYKEDITRIVMKLSEYRNPKKKEDKKKDEEKKKEEEKKQEEEKKKPWMKINDGVRMAVTVYHPNDAYSLAKKIVESHLGKKRVIKLDSKLTLPHLRNITLHGYNFELG